MKNVFEKKKILVVLSFVFSLNSTRAYADWKSDSALIVALVASGMGLIASSMGTGSADWDTPAEKAAKALYHKYKLATNPTFKKFWDFGEGLRLGKVTLSQENFKLFIQLAVRVAESEGIPKKQITKLTVQAYRAFESAAKSSSTGKAGGWKGQVAILAVSLALGAGAVSDANSAEVGASSTEASNVGYYDDSPFFHKAASLLIGVDTRFKGKASYEKTLSSEAHSVGVK